MHVDPDGARSFAVWLSKLGNAGIGHSGGWWLLFPKHGLAIALVHGTYVSWDGRVQAHCSAVPDTAPGDRLLSLFCSLPANAMRVQERTRFATEALRSREGEPTFGKLKLQQRVLYREFQKPPEHKMPMSKNEKRQWGKLHHRFVRAYVVGLSETEATLRVQSSGSCIVLTKCEVNNIVVIGWDEL